jgi:hypothetical protein
MVLLEVSISRRTFFTKGHNLEEGKTIDPSLQLQLKLIWIISLLRGYQPNVQHAVRKHALNSYLKRHYFLRSETLAEQSVSLPEGIMVTAIDPILFSHTLYAQRHASRACVFARRVDALVGRVLRFFTAATANWMEVTNK